jgi:hypothetical protein
MTAILKAELIYFSNIDVFGYVAKQWDTAPSALVRVLPMFACSLTRKGFSF